MIEYYAPDIENDPILPQEESAHCIRVLRKKAGDRIFVTDGKGHLFEAEIIDADHRKTQVKIISKRDMPSGRNFKIKIAVAPTKNADRIEWLVEKAVELGVDEIIPMLCDRNERKVMKTDRLNRIIVSAMKQSLKCVRPILHELTPLKEVVESNKGYRMVMGYCDSRLERKEFVKEYKKGENILIMIGPEGDFSPEEVKFAMENGVVPVTFGSNRLRTETAALFGLAATHTINEM